ncbi:uncharacterized protein [Antennarius striatus]|uniref:uncharacterized protein isoform X2 n=1 Tax=Antennarius striatus TaxID=241820 RepID=UPI0035B39103
MVTGSMTSVRFMTLVFVFIHEIDLSKAACCNYFEVQQWSANLSSIISFIETKDMKDRIECTIEREALNGRKITLNILRHCFDRFEKPKVISEKCEGGVSQTVPFYHFMCLTAKVVSCSTSPPAACEYDTMCREINAFGQTSSITSPTTTARTLSEAILRNAQTSNRSDEQGELFNLKAVLLMSAVLHVVVLLTFYLCMRRQRRKDFGPSMSLSRRSEPSWLPSPECESIVNQPHEECHWKFTAALESY